MHVHFGAEMLGVEWPAAVVSVGTFDGVHLGHQAVIGRAVELARGQDIPSVVVTFDRHPAQTLARDKCPQAISSLEENLRQFEVHGVNAALVLAFDRALAETTAEQFFRSILIERLKATQIVIGGDFGFGKERQGTAEWLSQHIETELVRAMEVAGQRVSSSRIRAAIQAGDMAGAAALLGRHFSVAGIVVKGQQLGRELGFPTVNLARSFDQVTPADGVYSGLAHTPHGSFRAAVGIGKRPAVGGTERTIEAFLLKYPGASLYGRNVRLDLIARLREERNFGSLDELRVQMERDVAEIALMSG